MIRLGIFQVFILGLLPCQAIVSILEMRSEGLRENVIHRQREHRLYLQPNLVTLVVTAAHIIKEE